MGVVELKKEAVSKSLTKLELKTHTENISKEYGVGVDDITLTIAYNTTGTIVVPGGNATATTLSFPVSGVTSDKLDQYTTDLINAMAGATCVYPSDITGSFSEDPNNPKSTIFTFKLPKETLVEASTISDLFENLSRVPGLKDAIHDRTTEICKVEAAITALLSTKGKEF